MHNLSIDEILNSFKIKAIDQVVAGVLSQFRNPAGKGIRQEVKDLSCWFCKCSEAEKKHITLAIEQGADLALYSILCLLDGLSFIEDSEVKGHFELYFCRQGERVLINDPSRELLTNLFKS